MKYMIDLYYKQTMLVHYIFVCDNYYKVKLKIYFSVADFVESLPTAK